MNAFLISVIAYTLILCDVCKKVSTLHVQYIFSFENVFAFFIDLTRCVTCVICFQVHKNIL